MNQFQDEKEEFWNRTTVSKKEVRHYFTRSNGKPICKETLKRWLKKFISELNLTEEQYDNLKVFNRRQLLIIKENLAA